MKYLVLASQLGSPYDIDTQRDILSGPTHLNIRKARSVLTGAHLSLSPWQCREVTLLKMPMSLVSERWVSWNPPSFVFIMYTLLCVIKKCQKKTAIWRDAEFHLKVNVFSNKKLLICVKIFCILFSSAEGFS